MRLITQSAETLSLNIGIEEAVARAVSEHGRPTLRLWVQDTPAIVVGRSEDPKKTVFMDRSVESGVPVVKRFTGGGTVYLARGVLNYALTWKPESTAIDIHDSFARLARVGSAALMRAGVIAEKGGISDLRVGARKIGGSAQARKWGVVCVHGTLLLKLDKKRVVELLRLPEKQPDYRKGRGHEEFLISLDELGSRTSLTELSEYVIDSAAREFGEKLEPMSLSESELGLAERLATESYSPTTSV